MRTALVSFLLFAVVSASIRVTIDTATADATSQATCIPYTLVPVPTTLTETYGEPSTLTLVDTETLGPQTDEATATQSDAFAFTILTLEPETFTVSITPPVRTVTVTVTPDPEQQTQVNTRTVVETDRSTTTETTYYSNLARRDIAAETGTIIKPTDIPSYASACTDPDQYSSACACLGVEATTIAATRTPEIVTVGPRPATEVLVVTATRPAITVTTTLPGKTYTVTLTRYLPDVTESTTLEASTASLSTTVDPDTVTITQEATHVDRTSVIATETRSVGPVCSTYAATSTCSCKFEIICDQEVNIDSNTFFHQIDFNTYVGNIEECMSRCDSNPNCQFGDFASLPGGGLCSSYSGNPGSSGRQGRSGTKYFEKDGNVKCSGCSL
ncbi:hypothetical protein FVEN_g918 [Fusarium venenatum]|uniref:Apple domain-containing protein n=1 Tax=Fusarium venenatum TaxID=56646 RepID=A0A2L2THZ2_9HYPO|nr:uncharacterized protein FVRRES_10669 [Fusarium venenatum]KAG8361538.1 hypothetical protein FVEN_g918 [Fusarium venenatum]KAH6967257.1 hypothetical protein EDB82DRAFT_530937 [Fusarium venenatum]CEI70592.1 unnamed protein product [Fusarium venenatum]